MNTGTQAAREAGNMIDLDSDPTKIIEIVEIGKELLITRGSLTTFSIANDVAKYFAIIPAIFATTLPWLGRFEHHAPAESQSAILSAVIFNALIIVLLIPLALKGWATDRNRRRAFCRSNILRLRPGWDHRPVHRDQTDRCHRFVAQSGVGRSTMFKVVYKSFIVTALFALILCGVYPLTVWAIGQLFFHDESNGSLVQHGGTTIGSSLIGQTFSRPEYFHGRPSAAGEKGYDATSSSGSNLGPTSKKLIAAIQANMNVVLRDNPGATLGNVPPDLVTASGSGLDPHISPQAAIFQVSRVARTRGFNPENMRAVVDHLVIDRQLGFLGEPVINVLELNLEMDRLYPMPRT